MCRKVHIQIIQESYNPKMNDVQLDKYGGFGFCITDAVNWNIVTTEDTELEDLRSNYATSVTAVSTKNIDRILDNSSFVETSTGLKRYRAILLVDGIMVGDGSLLVTATTDDVKQNCKSYSLSFIDQEQELKSCLKELDLCDLDFGDYTWGKASILALYGNNCHGENPGLPPIYPSLVHMGKWVKPQYTSTAAGPFTNIDVQHYEIPFTIHLDAVLEKALCGCGYSLCSRFLEKHGSKLGLLAMDYESALSENPQEFEAISNVDSVDYSFTTAPTFPPSTIYDLSFQNESDPNGVFDPITGFHKPLKAYFGKLCYEGRLDYSMSDGMGGVGSVGGAFTYSIVEKDGAVITALSTFDVQIPEGQSSDDIFIYFCTGSFYIDPSKEYYVNTNFAYSYSPTVDSVATFDFQSGGRFFNKPECCALSGDFTIRDFLPCTNIFDIFTDLFLLYGLRILVNKSDGKVIIEPEKDFYKLWDGTYCRGFFLNPSEWVDITADFTCQDVVKSLEFETRARCRIYKQKQDDDYPETLFYNDDETGLYGRKVDFGTGSDETEEITTTALAESGMNWARDLQVSEFTGVNIVNNSTPFIIHIWNGEIDDETGQLPEKIKKWCPRLVYMFGDEDHTTDVPGRDAVFLFEGSIENVPVVGPLYPFAIPGNNGENTVFDVPPLAGPVFGAVRYSVLDVFLADRIIREVVAGLVAIKANVSLLKMLCLTPDRKIKFYSVRGSGCEKINGNYELVEMAIPLDFCNDSSLTLRPMIETDCNTVNLNSGEE